MVTIKEKRNRQKLAQIWQKVLWNWHFSRYFSSKFCQSSSRNEVDKKFAKFCQTFVNLLFLAFCCWKILPNFCQKSEKNCKKKVDQIFSNVC